MMDGTRAAHLIPGGLAGGEAEQVEDIGQSEPGSGFGEVNARHGSVFRNSECCTYPSQSARRYGVTQGTEKRNP